MKTLVVDPHISQNPRFRKFLTRYSIKKGFQPNTSDLPTDLLAELVSGAIISFTAIDLPVNQEFMITLTPSDLTLKCIKQSKYDVLIDLEHMKEVLDIDASDEFLDSLSNPINIRRLTPSEEFIHPLSDSSLANGQEALNGYAIATIIVNAIRNPSITKDNASKCINLFKKFILESNRPVNIESLLLKVKAGYLREILEACTLINDGFNNSPPENIF